MSRQPVVRTASQQADGDFTSDSIEMRDVKIVQPWLEDRANALRPPPVRGRCIVCERAAVARQNVAIPKHHFATHARIKADPE